MSNIIKQIEQEQMKQDVPSFRPGDSVEVSVLVSLLVLKSVLTKVSLTRHLKVNSKQGVGVMPAPFLCADVSRTRS